MKKTYLLLVTFCLALTSCTAEQPTSLPNIPQPTKTETPTPIPTPSIQATPSNTPTVVNQPTSTATQPDRKIVSADDFPGKLNDIAQIIFNVVLAARKVEACPNAELLLTPIPDGQSELHFIIADEGGEFAIADVYLCADSKSPHMLQVYHRDSWEGNPPKHQIMVGVSATEDYGIALMVYRRPFSFHGWMPTQEQQMNLALGHFCFGASPDIIDYYVDRNNTLSDDEDAYEFYSSDPFLKSNGLHMPVFGGSVSKEVVEALAEAMYPIVWGGWMHNGLHYSSCDKYFR
ncbi:MAG: hypothetical protein HYZ23_03360 [Chloroflexi bacterium]|nr:hypothetical protein [Chloroflexota bacterium]